MSVSRIPFVALAAVVVLATTALEAVAQQPQTPMSNRPFRGVFGGGMGDTEQSLTVTGSFGGGYDSDIYAAFRGETTAVDGSIRPRIGGRTGFGSGSLNYSLDRGRVSLSGAAATTAYVYGSDGARVLRSHSASASQGFRVSSSTSLSASEYVSFQPFHLGRLFPSLDASPGAPPAPIADTSIGDDNYAYYGATVDLTQQVSRRASVFGGYGLQSSQWAGEGQQAVHTGRGGVAVGVARGLAVRLGYGFTQGRFGETVDGRVVRNHSIDGGVDFNRSLSFSRRTTLTFSTGSTAIRDRQQTHFRLTGRAQLVREMGRSWNTTIGYSREVQYLEQLREVLFSDGVNVSVGGLINRRQSFHAGAGVMMGDVGFAAGDNSAFASYASVGVVTAINRFFGLGSDYNYYVHSFGTNVALPTGILPEIDRHSVRIYLTAWAPLFSRARSSNASR